MKILHNVAFIILIIGGINLGIFGITEYDALWELSGQSGNIIRVIYAIVGIAALIELFTHKSRCKTCEAPMKKEINL